ncbi:winged helix-turn-helix transcriptional regulator [Paenibacillus oceani]|uniref:Winged helix-turn-helix transcriptional regulator n=1 Tax=Paenibacillus oceani TaxID=2772510 RepID=A0A927CGX0_9BACL|nr:winged helix-turn-helix transcriptional regulator [Paenibacillus oceani]MBD2866772.1 winged helix-turn-helix transcriptional regulator [Paenibacillus oceani]
MSKERKVIELSQELSGRWVIPILLSLETSGGRFTPLQNKLQITPARLSDNLKQMSEASLIDHLSPYERRHPLLPEYRLTEKGRLYREAAQSIRTADRQIGHDLSAKAWNVPVLIALHYQHDRFQDIRRALQAVTPRMLSARLDELYGAELIRRHVTEQPRPSFIYELPPLTGKPIDRMTSELCSLV